MKKILVFFGICLLCLPTVLASTPKVNAETVAAFNFGFEQKLYFWFTSTGTATFTADQTNPHSGYYCAKGVEISEGSLGRLYQDVTSSVRAGGRYKISGWIKTQSVVGQVVIALDYVASNGWTPADGYVREIGHVSGTTGWVYYESDVFTLPAMPADAAALWFLFDFNAGKGTAWWDDVSLIEVAQPPPLVSNPDFEQPNLAGWSTSQGTATFVADATNHHKGSYSARGEELNEGSLGRLYQDITKSVYAGREYKISGWIKTQSVVGQVVIALDYVASNGWTPPDGYVKEIGYVSGTSDWKYYESDIFTLPPMPSDASALWFLFDFNNGRGTAWWDDVSIVQVWNSGGNFELGNYDSDYRYDVPGGFSAIPWGDQYWGVHGYTWSQSASGTQSIHKCRFSSLGHSLLMEGQENDDRYGWVTAIQGDVNWWPSSSFAWNKPPPLLTYGRSLKMHVDLKRGPTSEQLIGEKTSRIMFAVDIWFMSPELINQASKTPKRLVLDLIFFLGTGDSPDIYEDKDTDSDGNANEDASFHYQSKIGITPENQWKPWHNIDVSKHIREALNYDNWQYYPGKIIDAHVEDTLTLYQFEFGLEIKKASAECEIDNFYLTYEPASPTLSVSAYSPVNILVTAPDGLRVGYDSVTDSVVNEIPGACYSGPESEPEFMTIPSPLAGLYVIDTFGTGTGPYEITIESIAEDGSVTDSETWTGTTFPDELDTSSAQLFEDGSLVGQPHGVIPEVPLGTILTSAAMIIALVAYAAMPKRRRKPL